MLTWIWPSLKQEQSLKDLIQKMYEKVNGANKKGMLLFAEKKFCKDQNSYCKSSVVHCFLFHRPAVQPYLSTHGVNFYTRLLIVVSRVPIGSLSSESWAPVAYSHKFWCLVLTRVLRPTKLWSLTSSSDISWGDWGVQVCRLRDGKATQDMEGAESCSAQVLFYHYQNMIVQKYMFER